MTRLFTDTHFHVTHGRQFAPRIDASEQLGDGASTVLDEADGATGGVGPVCIQVDPQGLTDSMRVQREWPHGNDPWLSDGTLTASGRSLLSCASSCQ